MSTTDWRDPWPSLQPDWQGLTWVMRGRAATAWFELPRSVVTGMLSSDLWPAGNGPLRCRLRFYDLLFEAASDPRDDRPLDIAAGHFREGVVGVPASARGGDGEVSLFMWTDSEEYLIWGREAYGWPIRLGGFRYSGDLWSAAEAAVGSGSSGECHVETGWGSAALVDVTLSDRIATGTPSGHWFTPRKVLRHAPELGEWRELLDVQPITNDPGATFAGSGRVEFSFATPHPLAGLAVFEAEIQFAAGFEVVVGRNTSTIPLG